MLVQVVEITYYQDARGADWATVRNAIPRIDRGRLPSDASDYVLVQYTQAENTTFRLRQSSDQYRPPLKSFGVMPLKDAVRIIPGRPSWALPKRSHQPNFEKHIPLGSWAQYQTNARFANYDGTQYFEWAINIAHPDPKADSKQQAFDGDPVWTVDLRAELF